MKDFKVELNTAATTFVYAGSSPIKWITIINNVIECTDIIMLVPLTRGDFEERFSIENGEYGAVSTSPNITEVESVKIHAIGMAVLNNDKKIVMCALSTALKAIFKGIKGAKVEYPVVMSTLSIAKNFDIDEVSALITGCNITNNIVIVDMGILKKNKKNTDIEGDIGSMISSIGKSKKKKNKKKDKKKDKKKKKNKKKGWRYY